MSIGQSGTILGGTGNALWISGNRANILNEGLIQSLSADLYTIFCNATENVISNHGTILSPSQAAAIGTGGSGTMTLINTGLIDASATVPPGVYYGVFTNNASTTDTIWNSGRWLVTYTWKEATIFYQGSGQVIGTIDGGFGNDTIVGGAFSEAIVGGLGNDEISGGGGNDVIQDTSGLNFISGGDGATRSPSAMAPTTSIPTSCWVECRAVPTTPSTTRYSSLMMRSASASTSSWAAGLSRACQANRPLVALINGFENAVGTGYADSHRLSARPPTTSSMAASMPTGTWAAVARTPSAFPTPSTPRAIQSRTSSRTGRQD